MKNVCLIKSFNEDKTHKNHIIFICDHATNKIPRKFKNLGLKKKNLKSHIAFDIGAADLSIGLAKKLKQTCLLSNFSRLLIDPNRELNDPSLIPCSSFGIEIPGNTKINNKNRFARINKFYKPYHLSLSGEIKKIKSKFKKIFLISIHSFTKKSKKFDRGYELGLLWNDSMNLLLPIQRKLNEMHVHYGRNYPYSGFHFNFTLDKINKNEQKKLDNISIEVRNDLICSKKGIKKYINILSNIFKEFLNDK